MSTIDPHNAGYIVGMVAIRAILPYILSHVASLNHGNAVSSTDPRNIPRCSFCDKSARNVKTLVAGHRGVHICNECVALCKDIVEEAPAAPAETLTFGDMRPRAIRAWLDEHIIGQSRAKIGMSVAVYNHFKRIRDKEDPASSGDKTELSKGNILLIGPTGTGKTLFARTLARRLGVPFTIADATTLTEAGYVGEDVESIVKNLWLAAGKDAELAGKGIVCIDEIDKISRAGGSASSVRDVGGEGVQQALLKIIEGQKVSFQPDGARGRPQTESIEVDTTNILFVCCGAFDGLAEIVQRRSIQTKIGFGAGEETQKAKEDALHKVRAEDLVKFGLIPELIGRLPMIISLDELTEDELLDVLWKPRNAILKQYERLLDLQGVKLTFEEEAMRAIVQRAIERKSGARGLRAIVEDVMLEVMYEIPSRPDIGEVVITAESIREKKAPLLRPRETSAA